MSDKTRAEYESIKARWQTIGGTVEDNPYIDDGRTYRYLTLREEVSMDLDAAEEAAGRFARLAVLDNAYLTMNVHPRLGTVSICVGVATYDVPQHSRTCERVTHPSSAHPCDCGLDAPLVQPAAVENVAREMLADGDAHGFVAVPTDPYLCRCGEPRAHASHGVTPDERTDLGLGVEG